MEYQDCYDSHDASLVNIETLTAAYEDERALKSFFHEMNRDKRTTADVKKRIRQLIAENDKEIASCSKRMCRLGAQLDKMGYDPTAYYIKKHNMAGEDEEWRQEVDAELDKVRPCYRVVDNVRQPIQYGASGYKGVQLDGEEEVVDVLDDEDIEDEEDLVGVARINVFREEDDAKGYDEAYSSNELAIKIGAYYLNPKFCSILKPHQREAVVAVLKQFGKCRNGFLLAHAMGLGKTLTTIACFEAMHRTFKNARESDSGGWRRHFITTTFFY